MEVNNKITFKYNNTTLIYKVWQMGDKYILVYIGGSISNGKNEEIFNLLRIKNRFEFCKKEIGYSVEDKIASFPELNSLSDLEKVVDALYQRIIEISTPKFQVGDTVMISKREGDEEDYPCNYTDEMTKYENRIFTISEVHKMSISSIKRHILGLKYEEPFFYSFEGIGWNWSSSMLRKSTIIKDLVVTALDGAILDGAILADIGSVNYCDHHYDYHCVPETPKPISLYDRIKAPEKPEKAEYKLNFKN